MTMARLMARQRLLGKTIQPVVSFGLDTAKPAGYCYVCGTTGEWTYVPVINDMLAAEWGLSEQLRYSFSCRESMLCGKCGASQRLRRIAQALVATYGTDCLVSLVAEPAFRGLRVAEINSCGTIHQFLAELPDLAYSEYGSKDASIPAEDLEQLSYDDATFDLVLTSDTLEHVPDFGAALDEIRRVLKPGGRHIFTIPTVLDRKTRKRAIREQDGTVTNVQTSSYHGAGEPDYLVFSEFGYDVIDTIRAHGFRVRLFRANLLNLDDSGFVFITTKSG